MSILNIKQGGTNSDSALTNNKVMVTSAGKLIETTTATAEVNLLDGMTTVSAGTSDNDKLVTRGYVDDATPVKRVFSFVATAGQTSFTLPSTPATPTEVITFRNGNKATYTSNFTVSGDTLTWVAPTLFLGEVISGFYNETGLSQLFTVVNKSASDTLALSDSFVVIEYTNGASDYTFTFPQDSEVAVPIGSWTEIRRTGTGEITLAKGTGATFRGSLGDVNVKINGSDGFSAFAEKTAANTWLISGSTKAV